MFKDFKILKRSAVVAVLSAATLVGFAAQAAVETFNATLSPTMTDFNGSLSIQQFNPALGTLQSVTITAAGTGQFTQYYQNLSTSSSGTVSISQSLDLTLSLASLGTLIPDLNVSSGTQTYTLTPYVGPPLFTGTSGGSQTYNDGNSTTINLGSSSLSPFVGLGSALFGVAANATGNSSNNTGNFIVGWSTLAGLDLTVSYNYLAVPEPATWMAGIFAMAGAVWLIGRRSPKASSLQ
jgi:hypothetical protein